MRCRCHRFGLHAGPSAARLSHSDGGRTPELRALIVESLDPRVRTARREAGEGPLHPVLPAISNAVFDAIGIRSSTCRSRRRACSWRGISNGLTHRSQREERTDAAPAAIRNGSADVRSALLSVCSRRTRTR